MHLPVIILHIDSDYKITYWIIRDGVKVVSPVTIPQTIQLLNTFEFDLIVSEPQKMAILKSPFKVNDPNEHEKSEDSKTPIPW
ncbi:MAG: hypothetical protein A2Y79_00420 [Deltaproteobacteria bacterium RBG_13_43_22]|nr:MAG: hypothetical protein A2Y79_00420 [Deltaproteobacteria bacterium RBG_13_43_22]